MKHKIVYAMLLVATASLFSLSCKKESDQETNGHLQQTKTYSSDVVKKWLGVQLPLLYSPAVSYGVNPGRYMAYCGVALYEAVVPGMPSYQSLYGQLNEMPQMPQTEPGKAYHWPTSANAALAFLNKHFFYLCHNNITILYRTNQPEKQWLKSRTSHFNICVDL